MQDALLSRNKVIALIDEMGYTNCRDGRDFEANSRVDRLRMKIQEMKPAASLDAILDGLDKAKFPITDLRGGDPKGQTDDAVLYSRAVEIVREGGL